LATWHSLNAVRAGDPGALMSLPAAVRNSWAGALVAGATPDRCWQVIELLLADDAQDFWSLCDVVYETLGRWNQLASDRVAREDFISRVLGDRRRMGAYALLEATLYLQAFTPAEVWFPLQETIRRLAESGEHDFELALIFDGLVWRPPAVSSDNQRQLFVTLLDAGGEREALAGAYAVACAYHPEGATPLATELGLHNPLDRLTSFSESQADAAAEIVQFHFAHQSRARAAWARRPFEGLGEGGDIDYLSQTTYSTPLPPEHAERVTTMIEALAAQRGHAGWAVHLGLNIQNTRGRFSDPHAKRITDLLPQHNDDAVIAAAATYETPRVTSTALRRYFAVEPSRRDLALDRLRDGFMIGDWRVRPPAFRFVRNMTTFWEMIGCDWERLNFDAEVDTDDPAALALAYEEVADEAVALGADPSDIISLLDHVRCGDLRMFEMAASAREGHDPHLRSIVTTAQLLKRLRESHEER
jgi:hypothetical protein